MISAAHVVTGQVVDAREVLLEIVDPARLVIEALAYDPALIEGITRASVPSPGGALELQFIGAARQLREQALPLMRPVKGPERADCGGAGGQGHRRHVAHTWQKGYARGRWPSINAGESTVWAYVSASVLRRAGSAPSP
ncbi:MAG: HlyD family secretion protein [Rhodoferax sp.]|nr:HlyD family secretion protein [Rhodoferax sp.]